jgi:hypothetical protein
LDKLGKFTPKIGYPVRWRDYSSLRIDPTDLMANVRAAHAFEFHRQVNKIGKPIDRDEWLMTPQTVNAYYNAGMNEIVFPAAILQDPFFNPGRDDAANYGAIGAVIGHEIGHGFDDQGSKYDGDGRLTDWWSATDRQAFETRTRSLIEQYNALAPKQTPDQHVNGALTIGENIGDLGGLGIAWKAYLVSLHGEEAPVIDGLTGAQRFFLSWARAWQQRPGTRKSSGCSPSTGIPLASSVATRSCGTSTSSTARLMSAPLTSCGSSPQLGCVSGSQGHTATQPTGGRDQRRHRPRPGHRGPPGRPGSHSGPCPLRDASADPVEVTATCLPATVSEPARAAPRTRCRGPELRSRLRGSFEQRSFGGGKSLEPVVEGLVVRPERAEELSAPAARRPCAPGMRLGGVALSLGDGCGGGVASAGGAGFCRDRAR